MADLELRKAALEASGLTVEMWPCYHDECGDWCPYLDLRCTFDALAEAEKATWWKDKLCVVDIREDNSSRHTYAPAVESDPGAFWPWFRALCRANKWHWKFDGGSLIIPDDCRLFNANTGTRLCAAEGADPCEAGCRAVIAAARRKDG